MGKDDAIITVFADHAAADAAIKTLAADGFALKHLSLVGRGCHTENKVAGVCNIGDRVRFWGSRGAFWGGMWGLFFGGLSAVGAAIASIGIPHDSVMQYETAIKADDFLVMAHGNREDIERARAILGVKNPKQIETHLMAPALSRARQAATV